MAARDVHTGEGERVRRGDDHLPGRSGFRQVGRHESAGRQGAAGPGAAQGRNAAPGADVWLAWQAWRNQNYEILAARLSEGALEPQTISESQANDWSPAIAADKKGGVYFTDPGLNGTQAAILQKAAGAKPLALEEIE